MIRYVLEEQITEIVDVIPAAHSPHKPDSQPAPGALRLQMLTESLQAELPEELQQRLKIRDMELRRPPPSYSAETCKELRQENPDQEIGLLLGSDSLEGLDRWTRPEEILGAHPIVIFTRYGEQKKAIQARIEELERLFKESQPRFRLLENPPVDCASRTIRTLIKRGASDIELKNCLPGPALKIIVKAGLYGRN